MSAISRERTARTRGASDGPAPTAIRRRWSDLAWLGIGTALLVLCALPLHAHSVTAAPPRR